MTITLTAQQATLTAVTVNGAVTVNLRRENRMPKPLQRIFYAIATPRPRFLFVAEGIQQLTF